MSNRKKSFRVGRVQAYLRGRIWYLCYRENGQRRRPRVGPDREAARQLAAQTNAQIEVGAPAALSFEPIAIANLRDTWLQNHESVLRSSVQTVNRYRTATEHFLRFLQEKNIARLASQFRTSHAEDFVRYLRCIQVAPNGHANAKKRPLLDKGIRYILETCRALFSYAARRRHLSPYAENPFTALEIDRIPLETVKPIELLNSDQERAFLEACDDWQFPLFLTLMLTGLRPGELTHLLLPHDLDSDAGVLRIRNKPALGWQVKTRNERDIPLPPVLVEVLHLHVGKRDTGPVFLRRRWWRCEKIPVSGHHDELALELKDQIDQQERQLGRLLSRVEQAREAGKLWRQAGIIKTDRLRIEFMRITRKLGLPLQTAPKLLRHLFATALQDANVDPLIRNELMGHSPAGGRGQGCLGMTAVYTHTRPETRRKQVEAAFVRHPGITVAHRWLSSHSGRLL